MKAVKEADAEYDNYGGKLEKTDRRSTVYY